MTTYLLNSAVLTAYGKYRYEEIGVAKARGLLASGFDSAVGHPGAADYCTALLGFDVPLNRIAISMKTGDQAVVVRIVGRLPEGASLSSAEAAELPHEIGLLTRVE